jgi:hypothetical protein
MGLKQPSVAHVLLLDTIVKKGRRVSDHQHRYNAFLFSFKYYSTFWTTALDVSDANGEFKIHTPLVLCPLRGVIEQLHDDILVPAQIVRAEKVPLAWNCDLTLRKATRRGARATRPKCVQLICTCTKAKARASTRRPQVARAPPELEDAPVGVEEDDEVGDETILADLWEMEHVHAGGVDLDDAVGAHYAGKAKEIDDILDMLEEPNVMIDIGEDPAPGPQDTGVHATGGGVSAEATFAAAAVVVDEERVRAERLAAKFGIGLDKTLQELLADLAAEDEECPNDTTDLTREAALQCSVEEDIGQPSTSDGMSDTVAMEDVPPPVPPPVVEAPERAGPSKFKEKNIPNPSELYLKRWANSTIRMVEAFKVARGELAKDWNVQWSALSLMVFRSEAEDVLVGEPYLQFVHWDKPGVVGRIVGIEPGGQIRYVMPSAKVSFSSRLKNGSVKYVIADAGSRTLPCRQWANGIPIPTKLGGDENLGYLRR